MRKDEYDNGKDETNVIGRKRITTALAVIYSSTTKQRTGRLWTMTDDDEGDKRTLGQRAFRTDIQFL
jgi:hypothetical protein